MALVRIVSWNVRYFGHATRGLASTGGAMRRISDALASLDPLPDIVCLQEVETVSLRATLAHPIKRPGETQLERLMEVLGLALTSRGLPNCYEAYYFPAHIYRLSPTTHIYTTGLVILAHKDFVIDHHNATAPTDITHRKLHPVSRLKQTRICAHVRFRHRSGETIDVFNTHLSLPSTFTREFWTSPARMGYGPNQLEEARNLARFVESERASDRFVIVGDFNALPASPVYRYLVGECGYRDAFAQIQCMSERELLAWPTAGFMALRMHIDHVFTGPGLAWVDFDDSRPFGDRSCAFHGLSDHMPVVGRCRVAGPRSSLPPPPR
jgi:endonuclease/exonuclease/phosphatase family metal-dependent hydrolase